MHDRRTLHLGRLLLTVPADAELREFSATINGVELEELELGDRSPEAAYLAWMQVSEQARETSGFDESELDERSWIALCGISDPSLGSSRCNSEGSSRWCSAHRQPSTRTRSHESTRCASATRARPPSRPGPSAWVTGCS